MYRSQQIGIGIPGFEFSAMMAALFNTLTEKWLRFPILKISGNCRGTFRAPCEQEIQSFQICKEIEISAPIEISFEAVLDQLGAEGQLPDGKSFPIKIEPWPGGRWHRDLGNNSGHL